MPKYIELAQYLKNLKEDEITLSLPEIEKILGYPLEPSAWQYPTFWTNTDHPTRPIGRRLKEVGWERLSTKLKSAQKVTFGRINRESRSALEAMLPSGKSTIYDLLKSANISTDDWHVNALGEPVIGFKTNPKYCYNWSFGSVLEGFAFCIWHKYLRENNDDIVFSENMRAIAAERQLRASDMTLSKKERYQANSQARRAKEFDIALASSFKSRLPLRAIISDGAGGEEEQEGKRSHVNSRYLDTAIWYIHEYDNETGDVLLVRGKKPDYLLDVPLDNQNEDGDEDNFSPNDRTPDKVQLRAIYIRQGQYLFRTKVRNAYRNTCAVTGCQVVDILEAAHIRPHAIEPNTHVTNGLLLRSDIHTLFDLHKLCIDEEFKIRVSKSLLNSEYGKYDGQLLTLPLSQKQHPNADALRERAEQFVE